MITLDNTAPPWARQMVDQLNGELARIESAALKTYSVTNLPRATPAGQRIYVSDESGGATPAFSDGTDWRRYSDRAVVS